MVGNHQIKEYSVIVNQINHYLKQKHLEKKEKRLEYAILSPLLNSNYSTP